MQRSYISLWGQATLIPIPRVKTQRLTGGHMLLALGKEWKGSSMAGPGARGHSSPGRQVCPGHPLLGPCRTAWSEPHHSGTESSSGKLASSPYLLALLHGWGAWTLAAPRCVGGGSSWGTPSQSPHWCPQHPLISSSIPFLFISLFASCFLSYHRLQSLRARGTVLTF